MTMTATPLAPFQPQLRDLVDRCFGITLHRLRGVRGLISGWIEVGIQPGSEHRLKERMEEDLILLGRLDWLRSMLHHTPPMERCFGGEAPAVLLSAALGIGTPEEAGGQLPEIIDPEAAIALAIWLQACTTDFDSASIRQEWFGNQLEIRLAVVQDHDLEPWRARFRSLLVDCEPHRLRFRPGCFSRWPEARETD